MSISLEKLNTLKELKKRMEPLMELKYKEALDYAVSVLEGARNIEQAAMEKKD